MKFIKLTIYALIFIASLALVNYASAAADVYYSVGQSNSTELMIGSPNITVASGVATFTVAAQTGNIGVGDRIIIGATTLYISGKIDTSHWNVVTNLGATPANISTPTAVTHIYRTFASLSDVITNASGTNYINNTNLVTADVVLNIPCYYDTGADTTAAVVSGYATDATRYIKIYTPNNTTTEANNSQRHSGKWDDSKFNLVNSTFGAIIINNQQDYTKIIGLQIHQSATGGGESVGIKSVYYAGVLIDQCIIRKSAHIIGDGISIAGTAAAVSVCSNTVAYGGWETGFNIAGSNDNVYTVGYNLSSHGNKFGYRTFYAQFFKNCIGADSTDADFSRLSNYDVNLTNCASSDGTADDFSGSGNRASQIFSFINSGSGDFHLQASDIGAKNYGTDLSADPDGYYSFSTDMDNQARYAVDSQWDIGADEQGATNIYYSVGQDGTTDRKVVSTVDITDGAANFSAPQTGNIGVGDAVVYDDETSHTAYISGKIDASNWTLITVTGGVPDDASGATVNSIKRVYTTLSAAIAGASGLLGTTNLVTGNYILNIPCYYDTAVDTTAVTVDGYTTGENNYIKIYTPNDTTTECNQSQRHQGKWDEGKYKLDVTIVNYTQAINIK